MKSNEEIMLGAHIFRPEIMWRVDDFCFVIDY